MPISILMPSLSPTMEEDFIKQGTMLCSVETDKTTVDYESMDEGFLRKIVAAQGTPAKVNQLIAVLADKKDEDISEYLKKALEKSQKLGGAKAVVPTVATTPLPPITSVGATRGSPLQTATPAGNSAPIPRSSDDRRTGDERRSKSSPLARKIAAESGISLEAVQGTGPSGRVVRRDVEGYKPVPASAGDEARPQFGSQLPPAVTQDVPLSMMRKTIARRLLESTQQTPVFSVTMKVETGPLEQMRSQLKRGPGHKISVNDIVIKASAFALRRHADVNASFQGDFIRQFGNVDVGFAVSLAGGLITPIVKSADQKALWTISSEVKALVAKAKIGKLAPEEYQGGTFTVSNLGMYGVDEFTAIVNPPQSAILSIGGIQPEVYLDGGIPKERSIMKITLNADHRVIDGALAAQFLSTLKSALENPVWLLL